MRETGGGTRRGASGGSARGRQAGYGREPAPRGPARGVYAPEPPRQSHDYGAKPARRRRRIPVVGIGVLFLVVVIAGAVVLGLIANAETHRYEYGTITAGVRINSTEYGGWEVERLKNHLLGEYQKKLDSIEIKLTWQDRVWTFGGKDLGATHNVEEVVSKASFLARVGTNDQRKEEAKAIRAQGREFTVQFALDPAALRAAIEQQTAGVASEGHDATVVFNPSQVDFTIPKDIEDLKPSQEEIDKMFTVNPEQAGKAVDLDMTVQKIMDALKTADKVALELIVNDFQPTVTEADLRKGFRLINAYRTKLPSTNEAAQPRIANIKLALSRFNGLVIKPGQELSFNETTGERSEANGYLPAPTIGGDKSIVDDYGGGVCQASTTLYNAVLMSGCEILKRQSHSFPSAYAWKGFDAMVNYPNADLLFQNTSDGNLYIKAYVKEPYVYVMVFGNPLPNGVARITRETELIFQGPNPKVEVRDDPDGKYAEDLAKGEPYVLVKGQPEMKYQTYLVYWDANGNVMEKKKLYVDRFREITRVEIYSVKPEPTPTPESTAWTKPESD